MRDVCDLVAVAMKVEIGRHGGDVEIQLGGGIGRDAAGGILHAEDQFFRRRVQGRRQQQMVGKDFHRQGVILLEAAILCPRHAGAKQQHGDCRYPYPHHCPRFSALMIAMEFPQILRLTSHQIKCS